jgi:hypothetical protein
VTPNMGDAIHDNVPALASAQSGLQLVAGYVTGTPNIQWTTSDWALFPLADSGLMRYSAPDKFRPRCPFGYM